MALGLQDKRPKHVEGLEIPIELVVAGQAHPLRALLDSGAQEDFISQVTVVRLGFQLIPAPLTAVAVDGHRVNVYGQLSCEVRATDTRGECSSTARQLVSTDMKKYDLILGKRWLSDVNPDINWNKDTWTYRSMLPEVRLCAVATDLDLQEDEQIYVAFYRPAPTARGGGVELAVMDVDNSQVPPEFADYAPTFSEPDAGTFPAKTKVEHSIPLEEGKTAPYGPIYPLSGKELMALRAYLDEALAKGWIQPSESPAGAPILFVPKKDGSLRLCVDYRGLNKVTVKNRYPLPLIVEILDRLSGAKFFTKLDLRDAYHRIRIAREDRWKTAFRTRYGQFEYLVMPFGLTNAPATFQAYINEALKGYLDHFCIVYMDDILVYSNSREEHTHHVRAVLERLKEYSLFVKLSKCQFYTDEVDFLGYRVGVAGVSMDPSKVIAIRDWQRPKTFREIQCFLGFANFYRGFIARYSAIVAPITDLLIGMKAGKKTGPLIWNAEAKQAFSTLKQCFQEAPLLKHYDPMKECRIEADASGGALGAVLSQPYESYGDSRRIVWHPIAFLSKKLSLAERNYTTGDQEMLAIVTAFKEWRHYLESPASTTRVLTDHEALLRFMDDKPLSRKRQTRWAETLSAYDFTIQWRRGKDNPADGLSRRPDLMEVDEAPRENPLQDLIALRREDACGSRVRREVNTVWVAALTRAQSMNKPRAVEESIWNTLPKPALAVRKKHAKPRDGAANKDTGRTERLGASPEPTRDAGESLARQLRDVQGKDPFCTEQKWSAYPEGKVTDAPMKGTWSVDAAGIVRRNGAAYIPNDPAIRQEIIRVNHDDPWQGGHFGRKRTLEVAQRAYWWPQIRSTVDAYVSTCDICQRMKVPRHKPYGWLEALPQPAGPWQDIAMDFITCLPPAKHRRCVYDAILVIVCRYSKMVKFIPCSGDVDAPELADILCDEVFSAYGTPRSIVSDRGSLFTSGYWATFCYHLAIRRRLSTAFHPQTDGQTERTNQTLECYLRCYSNYEQNDWPMLLASAEYACNNARSETTNKTPFEVVLTFTPSLRKNVEVHKPESENQASRGKAEQVLGSQRELKEAWEHAQRTTVAWYNKKRNPMSFEEGQQVLLASRNIRLRRTSRKLADKFLGPFKIEKRVSENAYRLVLPPKYGRIYPVFHVSLLQAYHRREGCEPPEPIDVEGDAEYEVERILAVEGKGKARRWLVRWKGYSEAHDSWEPRRHLTNAGEELAKFEESRET